MTQASGQGRICWRAMSEATWIQEVHLWGRGVGGKSEKASVIRDGQDFKRLTKIGEGVDIPGRGNHVSSGILKTPGACSGNGVIPFNWLTAH